MDKKMTYVDALNFAIAQLDEAIVASGSADWDEEARAVMEKLTALRDQTAKRNSAERKPTKTQTANIGLAEKVADVLRFASEPMTITEIGNADPELSLLSNQKITALVKVLGDRVVKTTDKRVSRFSLAE